MSASFLPYGRQAIDDSDIDAVVEVLRGDWLTTGPAVDAFDTAFAEATGARHAVSCSNGTAALHLALAGLGVGEGDTCIVPAITFMATANAARYCGAEIAFADVDPDTGLMTPDTLEVALARADGTARVVLPVHLAGQCGPLEEIERCAALAGAVLVEDASHAAGSRYRDEPLGNGRHSAAATFSFHPVKTIAAGEGGAVTTNDDALAARLRKLRSHGIERDPALHRRQAGEPWWHEMQMLGWNYRLSDIHAALALSQLRRLPDFVIRRQALATAYDEALQDVSPYLRPLMRTRACNPCLHLYPVRIDFEALGRSRSEVMEALKARGIGTQVHYIPVSDQPYYVDRYGRQDLPGARRYYERTLSLPLFVGMAPDDPVRVVRALTEILGL